MVKYDADVIIVGAGPAGSLAAYELATRGVRVLILEKALFPRYKVCGGGLTHKIIREIPFDVSEVIETVIRTVQFSSGFKHVYSRTSDVPLMYCTMRSKFDQFLLGKAINAGAEARLLHKVAEVREEKDSIHVITKERMFVSALVIGADGPSSIVARSAGLRRHIKQGLAWEAEITADAENLKKYSDTVFLDWGSFPGGYGWVFPKSDHFSVGVGGPANLSKQMIPYYRKFLNYLRGELQYPISSIQHPASSIQHPALGKGPRSWPIPVRIKKGAFHEGRILVAGDAAGLTDSLTGEGIYYAVRSGKLAAEACLRYMQGQAGALKTYSGNVNDELMTELLEGNKIMHIFNTVPSKIHFFVRDNDRAWRAFGKVLRGERSYKDVKTGFGKWKVFWNLAAFISGQFEKIKTWRYRKKND